MQEMFQMSDDVSILARILEFVWVPVCGWFQIAYNGHRDEIKDIKEKQRKSEIDLLQYKIDSEKTFSKEATMQLTLSRLHDRLDEVSTDIKSLIKAVAEK